jgi:tetratricopeptide (TPR) repeat protein
LDTLQNPNAYRLEASALKARGQLSAAEALLTEGLSKFPRDEELCIECAWLNYELGQFERAGDLWLEVRTVHSDSPHGYVGGGATYRKAGQFDEADALYRDGIKRFPGDAVLKNDYAWSAEERGDAEEAVCRWSAVRAFSPREVNAYRRSAALLRQLGQADDAELVLGEAALKFPESIEIATDFAWFAHDRRDWPEALKRWNAVVTGFPQIPDGRRGAAQALMELGRFDEASQVLTPASRLFPDDVAVKVLSGWLATHRRDTDQAESIWKDVRKHSPEMVDGYLGYALALRDAGRFSEADVQLQDAAARFPQNEIVAMDLASLAERTKNWSMAIQRWRDVVKQFPDTDRSHVGLANCLEASGQPEEAESVIQSALDRLPDHPNLLAAQARLATSSRNWGRALQIWSSLQDRFPNEPLAQLGKGQTLYESGDYELSAKTAQDALLRFPNNMQLEIHLALSLSRQRDWQKALTLWESLKRRHPGNGEVRQGIAQVLPQAQRDQCATEPFAFEIPPIVLANDADGSEYIKALCTLFKRFESLGSDCEFGIVQRLFQADPVGLLRWTTTEPEALVRALDTRFDGVGNP